MSNRLTRWMAAGAVGVLAAAAGTTAGAAANPGGRHGHAKHHPRRAARSADEGPAAGRVLLISIDGLHQSDLATWVHDNPSSTLAQLSAAGTTFTNASTTRPSDSFPGLLSMVTGGTPKSTGVYYDDSDDRTLFKPAAQTATSTQSCSGGAPGSDTARGAETLYAENLDTNAPSTANAGNGSRTILGVGAGYPGQGNAMIDPTQLPYGLVDGHCVPVSPNDFLRTNTVFGVAKEAGLRTAWSDKHPAYQIVNGHGTPHAVDDLFTPEINADVIPNSLTDTRGNTITFPFPNPSGDPNGPILTDYVGDTERYDQIKVDALLNQIDGLRSTGGRQRVGTPAIFGMNFQSVSVGQKTVDPTLCDRSTAACSPGYTPGGYQPTTLAFTAQMSGNTHYSSTPTYPGGVDVPGALNYVDGALSQLVGELKARGLFDSTRIIVTAKHGQAPINPGELSKIGHAVTSALTSPANNIAVAQNTDDDVAMVWLADQRQTEAAVTALTTAPGQGQAHVETVLSGGALSALFGNPLTDPRTPDLIVEPTLGTIYTHSTAKVAEHGGFSSPDSHVALLVAGGRDHAAVHNNTPVQTTQIAPTILRALGLSPKKLDAVRAEGTVALPGFGGP